MSIEPYIGEIALMAFDFEPRGWAFCDGRDLPINQNAALFSLLGTKYGGNGRTTFALPDLRGRVAVGKGQGPGLSDYEIGQSGGVESVMLRSVPAHSHEDAPQEAGTVRGEIPHSNLQPYLALNYIIALTGIFPSRG